LGIRFEVREKLFAGRLRFGFPFRFDCGEGAREDVRFGAGDADEIAVTNHLYTGELIESFGIDRREFRLVGRRAENAAVEHARAFDVGRVGMCAGDHRAAVHFRNGLTERLRCGRMADFFDEVFSFC
jgi:hypothetical protein